MYNRREFITKIFRSATLLSLAAVSGYLIFGRNKEEECDFSFVCRNCKKIKNCSLPEAQEFIEKGEHESF
jgi:Fe2+ or Zn2+ uptake regulation protein